MQVQNFIDGAFSSTSQVLDNVAPGTGEVYGTIPRSGAPEVDRAMAAKRAFPGWSSTLWRSGRPVWTSWRTRSSGTRSCLQKRRPETRQADVPCGPRRHSSGGEEPPVLRLGHSALREPKPCHGRSHQLHLAQAGGGGCISPWNLPLYLFTWKVAPALAAGNCVVAKPSERPRSRPTC